MRQTIMGVFAIAFVVGCGGANESPLGGPFGGSTTGAAAGGTSDDGGASNGSGGATSGGTGTGTGTTTGTGTGTSSSDAGTSGTGTGTGTGDAGTKTGAVDSGSGTGTTTGAPTWTQIYNDYIAAGTIGGCSGCHNGYGSASAAYSKGGGATWASPSASRVTWYGGNMPPSGPAATDPQGAKAKADMDAWAAAGALDN